MIDKRARLLIVALALPSVVSAVPPLRARAKAALLLAEVADLPFPRPFASDVDIETVELTPGVVGDLYSGRSGAPVILFVPGAALKGTEEARVIQPATALARAGRRVFVPELDLYDRTFRQNDIERIVSAIVELSSDDQRVGVLGFSYGGSLALIAGQDQRARGRVAYVATFGPYFDLVHVLQDVTTGFSILDGEDVRFPTVPEAREILPGITLRLVSEKHAGVLRRALDAEIETKTRTARTQSSTFSPTATHTPRNSPHGWHELSRRARTLLAGHCSRRTGCAGCSSCSPRRTPPRRGPRPCCCTGRSTARASCWLSTSLTSTRPAFPACSATGRRRGGLSLACCRLRSNRRHRRARLWE